MKTGIVTFFGLVFCLSTICCAQTRCISIQYLPLEKEAAGIGFYHIDQQAVGFYGGFQMTVDTTDNEDDTDIIDDNDPVIDSFDEVYILNIGLTKNFYNICYGYTGIGWGSEKGRVEKRKQDGTTYQVDDTDNDHKGININVGVLFNIKTIAIDIGYDTFAHKAYCGLGWMF